jgi:hypothetical protein
LGSEKAVHSRFSQKSTTNGEPHQQELTTIQIQSREIIIRCDGNNCLTTNWYPYNYKIEDYETLATFSLPELAKRRLHGEMLGGTATITVLPSTITKVRQLCDGSDFLLPKWRRETALHADGEYITGNNCLVCELYLERLCDGSDFLLPKWQRESDHRYTTIL